MFILATVLICTSALCACDTKEYRVEQIDDITESSQVSEPESEGFEFTAEIASDELLADTDAYTAYSVEEESHTHIVFKTDAKLYDLRFFEVTPSEKWAEDGSFDIGEILFTLDEFTPEKAFVAETYFAGVIPQRGISFKDKDGVSYYYTLDISAVDSSLVCIEAKINDEIKVSFNAEYASDELLADEDAYIFYGDPDGDWSPIAFTTDTKVTNLRFFSLVATDTWSDDGDLKIDKVLYTIEEFTPQMIFVVAEAVFADVYAIRGISFEDANGNTHYYSLYDSAVDGSIGLDKTDISE